MHLAFRVDASLEMGTGHLMRCLTLANHLRKRANSIIFLLSPQAAAWQATIENSGYKVKLLEYAKAQSAPFKPKQPPHAHWLKTSQDIDAQSCLNALDTMINWLIIDHYALDYRFENLLRDKAKHILVIDDLSDRRHDCDILLDQNTSALNPQRYHGLVPDHCKLFRGPEYALLKPEFLEKASPQPRNAPPRIHLFMGGTDQNGWTLKILHWLKIYDKNSFTLDVVIGGKNPFRDEIKTLIAAYTHMSLHIDTPHMCALLQRADFAIGAGGGGALERLAMGVPSLTLVLAENQREGMHALYDYCVQQPSYGGFPENNIMNMLEERLTQESIVAYKIGYVTDFKSNGPSAVEAEIFKK